MGAPPNGGEISGSKRDLTRQVDFSPPQGRCAAPAGQRGFPTQSDPLLERFIKERVLKYFCEELPEYVIACAGSLLGVALSRGASFPVGKVDFIQVYPVTFSEFIAEAAPDLFSYLDLITFTTCQGEQKVFVSVDKIWCESKGI